MMEQWNNGFKGQINPFSLLPNIDVLVKSQQVKFIQK